MKPLLIFGLRGTLVERIHVRKMPSTMPQPDLTVGLSKVWLRPQMLPTLLALQEHCNIALWSSTTHRNTAPLVEAVFTSPSLLLSSETTGAAAGADGAESSAAAAGPEESGGKTRFSRRRPERVEASAGGSAAPLRSPLQFQFVWSREHTRADDFRRRNAVVDEDMHATVKDLQLVFQQYPAIARPENTILIDDTPSKGKLHADNFLWLDTCEGARLQNNSGMDNLRRFILNEVCKAKDVRDLLPAHIQSHA